MSVDASIRESILACGIPHAALSRTLPLLGQEALRDHVKLREWDKKQDGKALLLYPSTPKGRTHASRVFQVMAKEFVLMGADIQLLSLTRLVRNVLGEDDEIDDDLHYRVMNAEVVMVAGFYDLAFQKNPHNDAQIFEFYNWLVNAWTAGKLVYLLADATVQRCTPWWDAAFLSQIEEHVTAFEVAGAP